MTTRPSFHAIHACTPSLRRGRRAAARALAVAAATWALAATGPPAHAEAWRYECFDCAGLVDPGREPHLVATYDADGHPLHWSATFKPEDARRRATDSGWLLVARGREPGAGHGGFALELGGHAEGEVWRLAARGEGLGGLPVHGAPNRGMGGVHVGDTPAGGAPGFSFGSSGSGGGAGFEAAGEGVLPRAGTRGLRSSEGPLVFAATGAAGPAAGGSEGGGEGPVGAIPEPGAVAVYALGLAMVGAALRRRRRDGPATT